MSRKLHGLSKMLYRSAERTRNCACLEKCSMQEEEVRRKKRVWITTDHRRASYKMISYAYKMCAVFQEVGIEFDEPENLEWATIAMFISKYKETYKDIMDEIERLREEQRSMYDDIDIQVCLKKEDYGASWCCIMLYLL